MAKLIQNIDADAIQRHTILLEGNEIYLTLRFYPRCTMWCMDVEYGEKEAKGIKLSTGVLHLSSKNFPFDFIVQDLSGNGIDPFKKTDFFDERCSIVMLEPTEMEAYRGVPVAI